MAGNYLIFGGSGGIGSAIARRIAAGGGSLLLVGRDPAKLDRIATETGADTLSGDVADPATFDAVKARIGDRPLSGLAYAVGTINLKPLARMSDADFLADFTVNALGAARAVRAVLPALTGGEGGASVLLFSSVAARQGFPAHASIGMAKAAVEGLALSLAAELAPKVRVNAVAPSLTRTDMAAGMTSNETMARAIAGLHPLGRLGEPDDIAGLAELLLTPAGSWITGQVFGVDGGRSTLRARG